MERFSGDPSGTAPIAYVPTVGGTPIASSVNGETAGLVVPLTEIATFVFTTTVLTALNRTPSMLAVRDDADEVTEGDVGGVALPEDDVIAVGLTEKAREFRESGGSIYVREKA